MSGSTKCRGQYSKFFEEALDAENTLDEEEKDGCDNTVAPEPFSAYSWDISRLTLLGTRAIVRDRETRVPRGSATTIQEARDLDQHPGEEWVLVGDVRPVRPGERIRAWTFACFCHVMQYEQDNPDDVEAE